MKMVRYDRDATQIVNDSGAVIAQILTMSNNTFRLYGVDEKPINGRFYTTRKKAFDAYVSDMNA